jgi:hypothetical protein
MDATEEATEAMASCNQVVGCRLLRFMQALNTGRGCYIAVGRYPSHPLQVEGAVSSCRLLSRALVARLAIQNCRRFAVQALNRARSKLESVGIQAIICRLGTKEGFDLSLSLFSGGAGVWHPTVWRNENGFLVTIRSMHASVLAWCQIFLILTDLLRRYHGKRA